MSHVLRASAVILAFGVFGCYHATVETGLTSSTEVIHETFASSWIYGLVPPDVISAKAKCAHGVAKVETQHSFVNSLVGIITFGIYTPMDIKVTCASAGGSAFLLQRQPDIVLKGDATQEEVVEAFRKASQLAVATEEPVFVEY
jgi:Bor protein